jgi:vacuolar-type H+-ATPase subunit H
MNKDILNEVIEAEREIQQCIEQEQERLRAWLDQVTRESAEAVARAEGHDGKSLGRVLDEAKQTAAMQAKQVVEAAEARAAQFRELDEAALAGLILKRLPRILLE